MFFVIGSWVYFLLILRAGTEVANLGEINASKTKTKKINKETAEISEPHVATLLKK